MTKVATSQERVKKKYDHVGSHTFADKEENVSIGCRISAESLLNHLKLNELSYIDRTSLFQILGVSGGSFHFYSNSKRKFCEQTVEILIRCLICVCTVCPCPMKRIWVKCRTF